MEMDRRSRGSKIGGFNSYANPIYWRTTCWNDCIRRQRRPARPSRNRVVMTDTYAYEPRGSMDLCHRRRRVSGRSPNSAHAFAAEFDAVGGFIS